MIKYILVITCKHEDLSSVSRAQGKNLGLAACACNLVMVSEKKISKSMGQSALLNRSSRPERQLNSKKKKKPRYVEAKK